MPCWWGGKSFDDLDDREQREFLDTELQVVIIETATKDEARDLFIRLQAGMPLNAQEKRDAWPGNFTEYILKVGGKPEIPGYLGNEFFNAVMKAKPKNRGDYRQLAAQMFLRLEARRKSGELCGIDRGHVDMLYYDNLSFDPQSAASQRFKAILDNLTTALSIAVGNSSLKKIVGHEAIHLMLLVDDLLDHNWQELSPKLPLALEWFRHNVTQERKARPRVGEFWSKYGQLTQTGSHAKETIEHRHNFFADKMLAFLNPKSDARGNGDLSDV